MKSESELGSRERMLEAAIALMRASGLSGAGINEVVRASGAPKGSVYHYFPQGKLQVVSEALAVYSARVAAFIAQALDSAPQPAGKVRALFTAFARRVEDGDFHQSCAVGTISLDLDQDVRQLQAVLADCFCDWIAVIGGHFDFGDKARTRSFAGFLLTAIEGAYVRCRAERSSQAFTEAGEWLASIADRDAACASGMVQSPLALVTGGVPPGSSPGHQPD
ncbi:MAG: TetR/AcrR family transcriptional regulator [Candidatus Accumulibacter sp.]|jgi:TetR/AcrR family transcriptional repressor of lmrAB and yxaGH operons|uniref:TetR/AcrR family transcriptional regulator n=1 Tax=Accumulibacter sp. TaxID=2053492 RepID=UPI001A415AAA|nr:TetR/AcrR family transcriptional regulator [Accumulibacter sp.]MBL8395736.1 TetR/AcrR family transcriptional regulator [Accumulibacter sp.]